MCDLIQRTLIVVLIKVMPSKKEKVKIWWMEVCAEVALGSLKWIGGARFDIRGHIAARPGVLLLMNHQSLIDIPVLGKVVTGSYPSVIARARYARGIPLISHMIRLYNHITVTPGDRDRGQLREIRRRAMVIEQPLGVYAEGTRSRDGELQPFRTSGLRTILTCRKWEVYIVVVDGLWKAGRFNDLVSNVSSIDAVADVVGPFEFLPERDNAREFILDMERRMGDKLAQMRHGNSNVPDGA